MMDFSNFVLQNDMHYKKSPLLETEGRFMDCFNLYNLVWRKSYLKEQLNLGKRIYKLYGPWTEK